MNIYINNFWIKIVFIKSNKFYLQKREERWIAWRDVEPKEKCEPNPKSLFIEEDKKENSYHIGQEPRSPVKNQADIKMLAIGIRTDSNRNVQVW